MDDLIRGALTEEATEAPFPADAWARQRALLADSGLLGRPTEPARSSRPNRSRRLVEIVAVAAVLLLALGLGVRWLPTAPRIAQGGAPVAAGGTGSTAEEGPSLPAEELGRLLPTSYWSHAPHRVVSVDPMNEGPSDLHFDRPAQDAKLDVLVPKLLWWLSWAQVVQESVPDEEVGEGYLTLHLEGGDRIWFAKHRSCWSFTESDCPFVVGGEGRSTMLVKQPDLWRWLIGHLWMQDLLGLTEPPTGRNQFVETHFQRAEIVRQVEADPSLAKAGLKIDSILAVPRYLQRQDADGNWHIDELPVWVIHLGPKDETGIHGEMRMIDDRSGVTIWQSATTIERTKPN